MRTFVLWGDFMPNAAPRLDAYEQHSLSPSYQPRSPRNSAYHKIIAKNYEELESVWDLQYQHMYGCWRPHVLDVIYKYLDCGDLTLALHVLSASTAIQNICSLSPASAEAFVQAATKNAWLNSVNICVMKLLPPCLIDSGLVASKLAARPCIPGIHYTQKITPIFYAQP